MKTKTLLLLFVAFTTATMAQITINNADLPTVNGLYIRDNAGNTSIIDLNVTGPNSSWDYTSLSSNGIDTIDYVTVASTNVAYQFFFNNPFSPDYDSDLAIKAPDFPSILAVTNVVNYFKISSNNGYYQTGFGATISGIPASVKYDPRDKVLPLPCTFGQNISNPFEWNFDIPGVGSYGQRKTRTVEVDGWGTLNLPNGGSYNTLRVKSTIQGIDTVYISQFSFGIAIPSTQLEYKWYAQGEGEPVLTVNATLVSGNTNITGVNHKHHEPSAIQSNSIIKTNLDLFPNPAENIIYIKYFTPLQAALMINLLDATGKVVMSNQYQTNAAVNNSYQMDASELSKGFYSLQVIQDGSISTAKVMIK
jgi:hypothetical protein